MLSCQQSHGPWLEAPASSCGCKTDCPSREGGSKEPCPDEAGRAGAGEGRDAALPGRASHAVVALGPQRAPVHKLPSLLPLPIQQECPPVHTLPYLSTPLTHLHLVVAAPINVW